MPLIGRPVADIESNPDLSARVYPVAIEDDAHVVCSIFADHDAASPAILQDEMAFPVIAIPRWLHPALKGSFRRIDVVRGGVIKLVWIGQQRSLIGDACLKTRSR